MSSIRAVPVGTGKLQDYLDLGVDTVVERARIPREEGKFSMLHVAECNASAAPLFPRGAQIPSARPVRTSASRRSPERKAASASCLLISASTTGCSNSSSSTSSCEAAPRRQPWPTDGQRGGGGRVYQHSVDRVEVYARGVERLFAMVHDGWVQREDLFSVPFLLRGMRAW